MPQLDNSTRATVAAALTVAYYSRVGSSEMPKAPNPTHPEAKKEQARRAREEVMATYREFLKAPLNLGLPQETGGGADPEEG